MSERDRIERQKMLMEAMRMQSGGGSMAQEYDPNQPVSMAGYPNSNVNPMSPSHFYQNLLSMGVPKTNAQQQTRSMIDDANMQMYSQSGSPWPTEGEY